MGPKIVQAQMFVKKGIIPKGPEKSLYTSLDLGFITDIARQGYFASTAECLLLGDMKRN